MNGSLYRDQDYAFGRRILSLRTKIGLTQAALAEYLGISRRSLADWEAGNKYPKPQHLQALIKLALQHQAFSLEEEAEEIRDLWRAAHQRIPFDEIWLATLLREQQHVSGGRVNFPLSLAGTTIDWGTAPSLQNFYGRETELKLLTQWIIQQPGRIVSVWGLGGIGKSALAVNFMRQIAAHFEVVIWRSLRNAPPCDTLLNELLRVLAPSIDIRSATLEQQLDLLLQQLHEQRVLIALDNLESLLVEGEGAGRLRTGFEGYSELLRRFAEMNHQSCLILTSREKPAELIPMEGQTSLVQSLRVMPLDAKACDRLLKEKGIHGTQAEFDLLIEAYDGNPLALKIVTQSILDLFGGEVPLFLEQGEVIFGGIRVLLSQHFERLSKSEQILLMWLAILREPVNLTQLGSVLIDALPRSRIMEALEALYRRALIERGQRGGTFTLQSVVLEYLTARLIETVSTEIESGQPDWLMRYSLELAVSPENIRQTQRRLLLIPVLGFLQERYRYTQDIEKHLTDFLEHLRAFPAISQGYAPANLINLLSLLGGHLRGLDLSGLLLRGINLQGIEMQNTRLTESTLHECVFTETIEALVSVSIGRSGDYWAANSRSGQIWVWEKEGRTLFQLWGATSEGVVQRITLSPDGQLLAGGYWGGTIRLWDIASGKLIWSSERLRDLSEIYFIECSSDGQMIAVVGDDGLVVVDRLQGNVLYHFAPKNEFPTLAWHPGNRLIATGDPDGMIWFWSLEEKSLGKPVGRIEAHSQAVNSLSFSPEGSPLASGSWDGTVRLWDVASHNMQQTLSGSQTEVRRVVWSADGRLLANSDGTNSIWLWDVETGRYRVVLRGHTDLVRGLAFTPDDRKLVSGSADGTLRVWDVDTGENIHVVRGYNQMISELEWSPDGTRLANVSYQPEVTVYEMDVSKSHLSLYGHTTSVFSLTWSPDGHRIASCSMDNFIQLWNADTGEALKGLSYPDDLDTYFGNLEWHPSGQFLTAGSGTFGIHHFDLQTGKCRIFEKGPMGWVNFFDWSSDGAYLAGAGKDHIVYIWDSEGNLEHRLIGHEGIICDLVWNETNTHLATVDNEGGLTIWDRSTWEPRIVLTEQPSQIWGVAWGYNDEFLITGANDGILRWWDIQTRECVLEIEAHDGMINWMRASPDGRMLASCGADGIMTVRDIRTGELLKTFRRDRPYERMDITGIRGLTEAQKATLRELGAIETSST